jgi:uncharacterized protein (UPF0333 family)
MLENKKAQASVEFLVLLAVAVFVLTAAVILSSEQLNDMNKLKQQNDARNTLMDISAAAKEVYSQGEGAKKQVYVVLPSTYEPNESLVENNSIKLRARGTDFIAVEDFTVRGSLPGTGGAHWVWVISEGNRVRIGTAMLLLSKNSIYVVMDKNDSKSTSFSAKNVWDSNISVTPTVQWTHTDVTMAFSPSGNFQLDPEDSHSMDLTFNSNDIAVGYYNGEISFTADDGLGHNETVVLPITVEVVGLDAGHQPPLWVEPDFWVRSLQPGYATTKVFSVCTNDYTAPTGVTFTPSSGSPGDWVGGTGPLGAMDAGSCQQKIMNITVPMGTAPGVYEGTIQVVGEGVPGAQDTIAVYITVEGGSGFDLENQSMCNCPVGSNYWGVQICNCQPATIYVEDGIIHGGVDDGKPYNGTLLGGPGADIIVGTNNTDIIYGDESGDLICGEGGDDEIYGGNGGDLIDGGEGNDDIYGEGGDDKLYGKAGADTIHGGQGWDHVDGGSGNDVVYGDDQDDMVYGGPGDDDIYGGDGKDLLCGNADSDFLYGDVANDELDGGTGSDTLNGGANVDDCYNGESHVDCENELPGGYWQCGPS